MALLGSPENKPAGRSSFEPSDIQPDFSSCRREDVSSLLYDSMILLSHMLPLPHYRYLSFKLVYDIAGTANENSCHPSPLPP